MSPAAEAQLVRWGLDDGDAERAGLFETPSARGLYAEMDAAPAIVIPYFDPATGALRRFDRRGLALPYARLRWLDPKPNGSGFGKTTVQRYTQPARSGLAAYFPPCRDWPGILADPTRPLLLTEGEAKALAAAKHGFDSIAFGGVYSFADRNGDLLPELASVAWRDRDIYICYDSDAASNPHVIAAEARLVEALQRQAGARVRIVRLPRLGEGKTGIDDYLLAHGAKAFRELLLSSPSLTVLDAKIIAINRSCAWIERESLVYDFDQQMLLRKDAFTVGSRHSTQTHHSGTGKGVREINVAAAWLRHPYAQRFSEVLFRPNEGATVTGDNGQPALNMWRGWDAESGDVEPFLKLTAHIFQRMRPEDRDLPLRLVAYKAQNPAAKIPLALVMVGPQGGGKSFWGDLVRQAFGAYGAAITAAQMVDRFNGWLERALIAVANDVPADIFRVHADRIRSLISEARMPMEEKYRPLREINNYTFFIINSNRRAVSSYDVDDRRMIVIDTPAPREKAFYVEIGAWLDKGGAKYLMHWLLNVPLGDWTPPQRAPQSDEKIMAYHEGLTAVQELAHAMLTARVAMVETWLDSSAEWARRAELSNNLHHQQLGSAIMASLSTMQVKPWYTPQELAMLFPSIIENTQGSRLRATTAAGQISRELREAGVPYLRNADDARGFWHKGQLKQYLIVSDFEEWRGPLKQADFDRLIGGFPTYFESKQRRGKR